MTYIVATLHALTLLAVCVGVWYCFYAAKGGAVSRYCTLPVCNRFIVATPLDNEP